MRIAFTTLGCKINQYETDRLRQDLLKQGNLIVPFNADADIYIVNTCSVTAKSDYQCRQAIRAAVKRKQDARVIVTGCYASVSPDEINAIPGVDLVVSNEDKLNIPDLLLRDAPGRHCSGSCSIRSSEYDDKNARTLIEKVIGKPKTGRVSERTRAFLKIQDGCNNRCAYCIVPIARGKSRSTDPSGIVREFDCLVADECPEIVLTGIHIGSYGADLVPVASLTGLLETLLSRRGSSRIRLSSIEANEITDSMISFLGNGLCRHLHIPLQSGDDSVLKAMNRHYDSSFYRNLICAIAEQVPGIALGADVIVGFPGEGEKEFQNTVNLIETLPLSHFHVFTYSVRPGTVAASMKSQVPEPLKKARSEVLRSLGVRKNLEFRRRFLGTELNVVIEDKKNPVNGLLYGLSDNYLRVTVEGAEREHIGRILKVVLREISDGGDKAIIL